MRFCFRFSPKMVCSSRKINFMIFYLLANFVCVIRLMHFLPNYLISSSLLTYLAFPDKCFCVLLIPLKRFLLWVDNIMTYANKVYWGDWTKSNDLPQCEFHFAFSDVCFQLLAHKDIDEC